MATVFRAHDPHLDRTVAIKVLRSFRAEDPTFVERFKQEARAVGRLNHPNIVQVHDFGDDKGFSYIVMEYVTGGTLHDHMAPRRRLSEVLQLIAPLADAVQYAHEQGVVHRDIKPLNVLIDANGRPKLTDFGLARILEGGAGLTRANAVFGTLEYMSPEQALGQPVDARSDLYALGVIIYQMLLGQTPFRGDTPTETLMAQIHEPVPPPSSVDPEIDPRLEANLIRALAKDPADRHGSATELIEALSSISAESEQDASTQPHVPESVDTLSASSSVTLVETTDADLGESDSAIEAESALHEPVESRRFGLRPIVIGASVATAVLVAGVLAYAALLSDNGPDGAGEPERIGLVPPVATATVSPEPTPLATALEEGALAAPPAPTDEPTQAGIAATPTVQVESTSDDRGEPDTPTLATPAPTISSGATGLVRGGAISGRVTDAATGQPIADVYIQVGHVDKELSYSAGTDSQGQYTVDGVAPGRYTVFADISDLGYYIMRYDGQPNDDRADTVLVEQGASVGKIDFALRIGGTISGRVTDAKTGLPVSGVSIDALNVSGGFVSGETDSDGHYIILGLAPGSHRLEANVSPIGYVDQNYADAFTFLGQEKFTGLDFELAPFATIAGRVTDASTGLGIPDMEVQARVNDTGEVLALAVTNEKGEYSLAELPDGVIEVVVSGQGYVPQSRTVSAGEQITGFDF
jgi:serine/threonine-protein kinase